MFGFGKTKIQKVEHPLLFLMRDRKADDDLTVHIDQDQIDNAEEVGIILAIAAEHFANALHISGKAESVEEALVTIRHLFNAELDRGSEEIQGGLA
ncbi:DUF5076 domain-containing protein [Roseibium sediminis]|uniref:DUF5076 domain-containing protein n=1 Tax=Roseibium sediminis TaxID=1775174 RepID=UPI00123D8AA8|nr:DUF5076 domain-containing protein [Roseibium sediminis]